MFAKYITPEKAYKLHLKSNNPPVFTLNDFKRAAKSKAKCGICGQPVWKLAMMGLCFSCTTGESDPFKDYELA